MLSRFRRYVRESVRLRRLFGDFHTVLLTNVIHGFVKIDDNDQ